MAQPANEPPTSDEEDNEDANARKRSNQQLDSSDDEEDNEPDLLGALLPTPTKRARLDDQSDSTSIRRNVTRHGLAKYVGCMVRRAVASPGPPEQGYDGPDQNLLHVASKPATAGPSKFIACTPEMKVLAARHGTPESFAKHIAGTFKHHHGKAVTQLNRAIRVLAFGKDSPHALAVNVMERHDKNMALAPALTHLGCTEQLQELLLSDDLYNDPKLYVAWRNLLASGKIPGTTRQPSSAQLPDFMSVQYEAHFRSELAFALTCQAYRHSHSDAFRKERALQYVKTRKMVKRERKRNYQNAEAKRIDNVETEFEVLYYIILYYSIV